MKPLDAIVLITALFSLIVALIIVTVKLDEFAKRQDAFEARQKDEIKFIHCVLKGQCVITGEMVYQKK